ncbi:MAG: glycosyltransferase family 9 protein [Saprospiraceae bacterium]|nr:glycosyltransferase family 9 protein [Saprospiraceae bacterium]
MLPVPAVVVKASPFNLSRQSVSLQILVIQTAFTGDVILGTSLIESLHRQFPEASIDFLLRKGNESLLTEHPHIRKTLVWDKKQHKFKNLFGLIRQVRKQKYDLLVNCQRFFTSGLIAALSGAREVSGFKKNPLSIFFDHRLPHEIGTDSTLHEIDRNHRLIEHFVPGPAVKPKLYPTDTSWAKTRQTTPYICIAPTSVWHTKQWPAEKWIALIHRLPKDLKVFLLGAPSDQAACAEIGAACPVHHVQNMAGNLSLLDSAALMAGAQMNYVNDSAPAHLASAMNAPVSVFFCSTIPAFGFGPLSGNSHIIQTSEKLACRPCGLHGHKACPQGHFKCADIDIGSLRNF